MSYYINCLIHSDSLTRDIKTLVPDMNMRRRMSRILKMGVCTAMESVLDFDEYGKVDAIITGTSLGCIADSEKFLANIITSEEKMLNPTPFIQSTFNTVGGQIAIIRNEHCYNNTFSHRSISLECALTDAMLCLDNGHKAVLTGVFDEATPTVINILERMRLLKGKNYGEGAVFFILTKERYACSVARIDGMGFESCEIEKYKTENCIRTSDSETEWCGSVADKIRDILSSEDRDIIYIINDIYWKNNSFIKLQCL